jgi:hypothetical protein
MKHLFLFIILLVPLNVKADIQSEILKLIEDTPNHPLNKDRALLEEVSNTFLEISEEQNIPWELLISIAYYESAFRRVKVGKLGERGYMQIHGVAIPFCEDKIGRKSNRDIHDNILCGAIWLNYCISLCDGSYKQGLSRYMTGRKCGFYGAPIKRRLKLYETLRQNR